MSHVWTSLPTRQHLQYSLKNKITCWNNICIYTDIHTYGVNTHTSTDTYTKKMITRQCMNPPEKTVYFFGGKILVSVTSLQSMVSKVTYVGTSKSIFCNVLRTAHQKKEIIIIRKTWFAGCYGSKIESSIVAPSANGIAEILVACLRRTYEREHSLGKNRICKTQLNDREMSLSLVSSL